MPYVSVVGYQRNCMIAVVGHNLVHSPVRSYFHTLDNHPDFHTDLDSLPAVGYLHYIVIALLPAFIMGFLFSWFASPRFGMDCDPIWTNETEGIFTCVEDKFSADVHLLCCKIQNQQLMMFVLIAFLYANGKAGMSLISAIADFFLEVKKFNHELGGKLSTIRLKFFLKIPVDLG